MLPGRPSSCLSKEGSVRGSRDRSCVCRTSEQRIKQVFPSGGFWS